MELAYSQFFKVEYEVSRVAYGVLLESSSNCSKNGRLGSYSIPYSVPSQESPHQQGWQYTVKSFSGENMERIFLSHFLQLRQNRDQPLAQESLLTIRHSGHQVG